MSDLRLKSIEIRNWMTVRSARIDFPEKGLVLVIGHNQASEGKLLSVGAGKTALGEALSRALLGVTGRFSHLGYYLPDGTRDGMYVKVEADLQKKPFVVEMGFRCPEMPGDGEALRFKHGDYSSVQAARSAQTRSQLGQTLQVTPELAGWTTFIDGDKLKFNRISQEDSVNLLMTALAQPPWTEYLELANKKLQAAKSQVKVSERALDVAKENLACLDHELKASEEDHRCAQEDYERQKTEQALKIAGLKAQIKADKATVKTGQTRMTAIKKELAELEKARAEQNHKWDIERQALRDDRAEIDETWAAALRQRTSDETQLLNDQEVRDEMQLVPKNCPKCGKPWDQAHSEEALTSVQKKIEESQKKFNKSDKKHKQQQTLRSEINNKITELDRKMRSEGQTGVTQELGFEYNRLERQGRSVEGMIQQREVSLAKLESGIDATFVNKKLAVVEERRRMAENCKLTVETAANDLTLDQETEKVVQYWYRAYSSGGIPNMILSDAVPMLNRIAQRISAMMTGGTLQVSYSTTRLLVSGEPRPQLVTKVTNRIGSKRMEGSSKGESGLTNLIISENLNEVGQVSRRIGYRWYDEVTSGQDSVVRQSIFTYLKEVANQQGILIFVVDHHSEAANFADYVLVAEKSREQGTVYHWR